MSLDLELIEAGSPTARVIEIAAVRFDEHGVLDQWSSLVDPGGPVPYAIRVLTGIDDEALAGAPTLDQLASGLRHFLGDEPIVGQSIELDVAQLARQGIAVSNPLLDTFELASLLLPGLRAYDLPSIATALGIHVEGHHRALQDADLAREVFLALVARVRATRLEVLMHVLRLGPPRWPYRELFVEAERAQHMRLMADIASGAEPSFADLGLSQLLSAPERPFEPLVPHQHTRHLDAEALRRALGPTGEVAATLPAYEERPEQLSMLQAVCDAFNKSEHLIVEAGTGTGKSLAYLLPALAYAAANNRRVVVSTNTINLQDQLHEKDVPDLVQAMDYQLRASVLKGRANYVCLRRWLNLLKTDAIAPDDASLLIKTLFWIGQTKTGDRAELRLTPEEELSWLRICSQSESCSSLTCPYHRDGSCFIARARRAAEESHLVIVNHSLLLSDLLTNSRVIPEYEHLIIDEAHHLEEEATAQLGYEVSTRSFALALDAVVGAPGQSGVSAPGAVALLRGAGLAERRVAELAENVDVIRRRTRDARGHVMELFEAVHEVIEARAQPGEVMTSLRLTSAVRHDGAWSVAEQAWEDASAALEDVRVAVGPILEDLADAAAAGSDVVSDAHSDLLAAVRQLEAASERAQAIVGKPAADTVCWGTFGTMGAGPTLHLAPLDVASQIRAWLLETKSTVVLTSATLSTEGSFEYIRQRLGAEGARELALGSPFDYATAALLFLPTDMPEPNQPGYVRRAADAIAEVAEALGGRTLALFTSYAQLRATHDAIRQRVERANVVLMGQGIDGSRSRLLQRFKDTDRALLLGTASFWEGVDVVGEALSALIIARLPFAVPTDPVFAARSEEFDEPFRQYAVPQAILRFKQGFGRLIRSKTDRGVVVVLDRRILSKSYGASFLGSLPACSVHRAPIAAVGDALQEWIGTAMGGEPRGM